MFFAWTLAIGLAVGGVAWLLLFRRDSGGILTTAAVGVGGAFLAALVGDWLGSSYGPWTVPGFASAVVGAVFLLLVYRLFVRVRRRVSRQI